jgi:hypothetical protein
VCVAVVRTVKAGLAPAFLGLSRLGGRAGNDPKSRVHLAVRRGPTQRACERTASGSAARDTPGTRASAASAASASP